MILKVLLHPDDNLRKISQPVVEFDNNLKYLVEDMFETMYLEEGIGLAAPQINQTKRLITIDINGQKENQIVLINPEIISTSGVNGIEEGCLSIPGIRGFVERHEKILVSAYDLNGEKFEMEADDLLSICIQHEIDHLDGKLFVDYLSPLKQSRIKQKMEKYKKQLAKQNK